MLLFEKVKFVLQCSATLNWGTWYSILKREIDTDIYIQTPYRYKYAYTFNQGSLGKIRPPNKWTQHLIIHTVLCIVEEASINNCSRNAEIVKPPQSQCPLQPSSMPTPKSWAWLLSYWYVNDLGRWHPDLIQGSFFKLFKFSIKKKNYICLWKYCDKTLQYKACSRNISE